MADFSDITLHAASQASKFTAMGGKWYFVDPTNGSAGADGTTPRRASSSFEAMYAKLRTNKHDGIFFIPGATRNTLTAAITWDKSYCHVVGLGANLASGHRAGILGSAASDLATLITVSGNANTFENIKFVNEKDANSAQGGVYVSGERNYFGRCEIVGICHATPAARTTDVYDLKIGDGGENTFEDCQIGADTIDRTGASANILFAGTGSARNVFRNCRILCRATTGTSQLFAKVSTGAIDRYVLWSQCQFINTGTWVGGGTTMAEAFDIPASPGGVFYMNDCKLVGCTDWEAATVSGFTILDNPIGAVNGGLAQVQTA